jgi:hypothetical protein
MQLDSFYSQDNERFLFSREQASRFAKEVANDFNPLHNPDAKMFCVPGDLLFSVALSRIGLSQEMCFNFSGMVTDDAVIFPESNAEKLDISDADGKCIMSIERRGEISRNKDVIEQLTRDYVAFSGKTFPHILVPLMSEQGVMINPARPLVIYQKMEIALDRLDLNNPRLEASDSSFEVLGKKGTVKLNFKIKDGEAYIGHGAKHMSLRGLRDFDSEVMSQLAEEYNNYRSDYLNGKNQTA